MPKLRRDGSLAQVNRDGCGGRSRHPDSVIGQHLLAYRLATALGLNAV